MGIARTESPIVLDGILDEEAWSKADVAENFHQYFPSDTAQAQGQSEVRMTYDDQFLYVATKCYGEPRRKYLVTSLRRDYRGSGNDGISLIFDPFQDQNNAFFFGLTPYGVQREALISNGGRRRESFSLSWDNKWYAEAKIYEDHWIGEIAIPFKTLRFKEGSKQWRFNSYRLDTDYNERSTWAPIPRNFNIFSLAHTGKLNWDQPLKKPGSNISVIPYIASGVSKDHENDESAQGEFDLGMDAKIALTPSLNLDLTINPDFSQVEVDRQVTNLTRFELRFPERRQFFLENSDLFAGFGHPIIRPFFSRRIGLAFDSVSESTVENSINFGMRLSGNIDQNWRVGLLNMQTAKDKDIDLRSYNYTVAAVQRRIFDKSNIAAIFVNRQTFQKEASDDADGFSSFNRMLGLDYNLVSNDNRWSGKLFYHRSFEEFEDDQQYATGGFIIYQRRNYRVLWSQQVVGKNFNVETGFVPRLAFQNGYHRMNPEASYFFYPRSGSINQHGPELEFEWISDQENGRTDQSLAFAYELRFTNTSRFKLSLKRDFTFLFADFDPSRKDGVELPAGTDYSYNYVEIDYNSDPRKTVYTMLDASAGKFFNGNLINLGGTLFLRLQPYGLISLDFDYNRVRLPDPYSDADLFLLGPRFDLTFSKKVFLTTFIQYNNRTDNLNINARLQWRYKPVSDLFLVYTDNYFPDRFQVKNRALVLKLTYWLNL